MNNIIFYIRNTAHLKNYVDPYYDHFLKNGYKLHILHFDSLTPHLTTGSKSSCEYEMTDIFGISTKKLIRKIRKISPIGIISINFLSVMDLFVNRLGNKLGIPVLYMEHGLILEQAAGKYIRSKNKIKSTYRLARYTGKYLSLCTNGKQFFKELNLLTKTQIRKDFTASGYNAYLFYAKNGYNALNKLFKLKEERVKYSGYPVSSGKIKEFSGIVNKTVLYIHQPFVFHSTSTISYSEEFQYLTQMSEVCQKNGYQLVVKLHPAETEQRYADGLSGKNIKLLKDADLIECMNSSSVIAGHYSTALFTAVILKKPLVVLKFPGINENFSSIFRNFALKADTMDELNSLFRTNQVEKINIIGYDRFIEQYIGYNNNFESRTEAIINVLNNKSL